jgi:hypothetical protein
MTIKKLLLGSVFGLILMIPFSAKATYTCSDYNGSGNFAQCITHLCAQRNTGAVCFVPPATDFSISSTDYYCSGGDVGMSGTATTNIYGLVPYSQGFYDSTYSTFTAFTGGQADMTLVAGNWTSAANKFNNVCSGLGAGQYRWITLRYNLTNTEFLGARIWGEGSALQPSEPILFSPALPYVSSSTPIRFTTLNENGGTVTCANTTNDWRKTGPNGGTNSYSTFSVDMEEGVNNLSCYSTLNGVNSSSLVFSLTYTNGSGGVPTPLFDETQPNYTYSYNPIRVSVTGVLDGDIWCKRGSGSFGNKGSVLAMGKVYFDLDFTDLGTLADGLEYPVSCYLETEGGNSDTVTQIYTYHERALCAPDLGIQQGDQGLINNVYNSIYYTLASTPILGDLIYIDCVIYNDFYSNLTSVTTTDLSYNIKLFGVDQAATVPLTTLKSSMGVWIGGSTGYSGIKTLVTTVVWCLILFGLFFGFVFPEIRASDKADDQTFKKWSDEDYHNETTKMLDL